MEVDLLDILRMKTKEFKGVNFVPFTPEQMDYMVSHDLSPSGMKHPGPRFPETTNRRPSITELVQNSDILTAAANQVMVRTDSLKKKGSKLEELQSPRTNYRFKWKRNSKKKKARA